MPGGVNSPVRAMRQIGRDHPIFIERGEGCELVDVDGNRYVDWVCSWGPLILGHAHPTGRRRRCVKAPRAGPASAPPPRQEVELAAEVCERFRSVEMIRMVSSGTEATMSALRLARAATGPRQGRQVRRRLPRPRRRPARRGRLRAGDPGTAGEPGRHRGPGGRHDRRALERPARRLRAAVVGAPPGGDPGRAGAGEHGSRPARGRLPAIELRELADGAARCWCFDEVISGFRVARGGAQEAYGVEADLTVMGKVLGGGLPAAAFGGRRDLMSGSRRPATSTRPAPCPVIRSRWRRGWRRCASSTTRAYERLAELTDRLAAGLREAAGERPVRSRRPRAC